MDYSLIVSVISLSPLSEVFPPSQVFSLAHGSVHSCGFRERHVWHQEHNIKHRLFLFPSFSWQPLPRRVAMALMVRRRFRQKKICRLINFQGISCSKLSETPYHQLVSSFRHGLPFLSAELLPAAAWPGGISARPGCSLCQCSVYPAPKK